MPRPLKAIDADEVYKLARLGCTQEEIAEYFGCARSVIGERFRQDYELGKAASKTSIRRWQMKKGRSGCTAMLIHLGKVYLKQRDKDLEQTDLEDDPATDENNDPIEP